MAAEAIDLPNGGLVGDDVRLRPCEEADIPALVRAVRDPEIPKYTRVPSPYTEADGLAWIGIARDQLREGAGVHLLVTGPEADLLGAISIHGIDTADRRAEIGYWLAAEARRRGVAARAVRRLSAFGFESLGLERLSIYAAPENVASRHVAEAAGYTAEGVLRGWIEQNGRQVDAVSHCLLREDLHPFK